MQKSLSMPGHLICFIFLELSKGILSIDTYCSNYFYDSFVFYTLFKRQQKHQLDYEEIVNNLAITCTYSAKEWGMLCMAVSQRASVALQAKMSSFSCQCQLGTLGAAPHNGTRKAKLLDKTREKRVHHAEPCQLRSTKHDSLCCMKC